MPSLADFDASSIAVSAIAASPSDVSESRRRSSLPAGWLAAIRLPLQTIDPSHLRRTDGAAEDLPVLHQQLWGGAPALTGQDLLACPAALALLKLPREAFSSALQSLGLSLLEPQIRRIIHGPLRREVSAVLRVQLRPALTSHAADPVLEAIQTANPISWESVRHLGADAPLAIGVQWLHCHCSPISGSLWALMRLRLPQSVLGVAELDDLARGWGCSIADDRQRHLRWFADSVEPAL